MKFIFISIIGIIYSITESSKLRSESSLTYKNENLNQAKAANKITSTSGDSLSTQSDLEFFNNLYSSNSAVSTSQAQEVSSNTLQVNQNPAILLQDWLMISSNSFRSFPPIRTFNGTVSIQYDSNNFRINMGFPNNPDKPPSDRFFWFRLSGINLYYSSSKTDYNILGSFDAQGLEGINPGTSNDFCFSIKDTDNKVWLLCAKDTQSKEKWLCALRTCLKVPVDNTLLQPQPNVITKTQIQPIIVVPVPSPFCNENWNYKKKGLDWNCDCAEGKAQSPIDLPNKISGSIDTPAKPIFAYEDISFKATVSSFDGMVKAGENLKIRYLDNSLRIVHHYFGKIVTLDGAIYHAQEIAIHTPSEHKIEGRQYDMEVQILHFGQTVGDIAKQVVLSFLFEKKAGTYNKFIEDLDVFNLPSPLNKEVDLQSNIYIPKIFYTTDDKENPTMKPFSFYTYQGSLTSPPCTESTIVYVASKVLPIGTTALTMIQEAIRIPDLLTPSGEILTQGGVPASNREVQPLNGRPVFHYDHAKYCGPDPVKKEEETGHYEKVVTQVNQFVYVPNDKPSGIPGAIVVNQSEMEKK
jgi:carbonic anhydrase